MALSNTMITVALINSMIGGVILVLPVLAMETQIYLIAPVTFLSGFMSFFSCLLCLRHLKNSRDLDQAILEHFDNNRKYKVFYDLVISFSLTFLMFLYFDLICQQWVGIIFQTKWIAIANYILLVPLIFFMKKMDFGASLMAYGIASIVGYVVFLLWMAITTETTQDVEPYEKNPEGINNLAAALAQGFAIQTFFIPVLKKNPDRSKYKILLIITYIFGFLIYLYIGQLGSFCVINRTSYRQDTQTIQAFFQDHNWQVMVIEFIYLVHLYSVFPEFIMIAKERLFSAFQIEANPQQLVQKKQLLFYGIVLSICLGINLLEVEIKKIIEINGSIISFCFIYLIPIGLHIKCVYFSDHKNQPAVLNQEKNNQMQLREQPEIGIQKNNIQIQMAENGDHGNQVEEVNTNSSKQVEQSPNSLDQKKTNASQQNNNQMQTTTKQNESSCEFCDIQFKSKFHEYAQLTLFTCMFVFGIYTMVLVLIGIVQEQTNK